MLTYISVCSWTQFLVLGLCCSLDFSAVRPNSHVGLNVCRAVMKYLQ